MIRFVPGLVAAVAAFVVLKLLSLMDASLTAQAVVFLLTYLAVAVGADYVMKGNKDPKKE
jgi:membrane protein implicated in regulation of membrane protease activity